MAVITFNVFIVAFVAFMGMASAANDYPAVLVHGIFGDGDRSKGINWGSDQYDIQEEMKDLGYEVFTADMGPISSNWDRACELYAQIMGGTVDYGASHSARYGHARFGRTYPRLVTTSGFNWGASGGDDKLHLIAHSMGGQTVRLLSALLEDGDSAERSTSGSSVSPLFAGGKNASEYIATITTIQAPHDGSTIVDTINNWGVLDLVITFAVDRPGFDFQWDHWGCGRQASDSDDQYINRIKNCKAVDTNDYSVFDVSTAGAKVLNQRAPVIPDIYHFTYASYGTKVWWWGKAHNPLRAVMSTALWVPAFLMGRNNDIGDIYRENDGVVPTYSQVGPHRGSRDSIVAYNGYSVTKGVWNHMETGLGDHDFRQSPTKTLDNMIPFWKDSLMPLLYGLGEDSTSYVSVAPARYEMPSVSDEETITCDEGFEAECAQYIELLEAELASVAGSNPDVPANEYTGPSSNTTSSIMAGAGLFAAGALICAGLMVANDMRKSNQNKQARTELPTPLMEQGVWMKNRLSEVNIKV